MFLREIAKVALCQWALDEVVQTQMAAVAQAAEEVALVAEEVVLAEAELAAAGKIWLRLQLSSNFRAEILVHEILKFNWHSFDLINKICRNF